MNLSPTRLSPHTMNAHECRMLNLLITKLYIDHYYQCTIQELTEDRKHLAKQTRYNLFLHIIHSC